MNSSPALKLKPISYESEYQKLHFTHLESQAHFRLFTLYIHNNLSLE